MSASAWLLSAVLGPFAQTWEGPVEIEEPSASAPTACRDVQGRGAGQSRARIARAAPDDLPNALTDAEPSCERALPALRSGDSAAAGDLAFDLDLRALSTESRATRVSLPPRAQLPADTSTHELLVAQDCSEQTVPLDAIEPAITPGVALALVPTGQARAVAARNGAVMLRDVALPTLGKSLALLGGEQSSLLAALLIDPDVESAQPDYVYRTSATASVVGPDPLAALSYASAKLQLEPVLERVSGRGVDVAVIDTGVDLQHPDLVGRRVTTLNTATDDFAPEAHGTAVVGLIAAASRNAEGSFGLAPDVSVLAIRACAATIEGGLAARCRSSTLAPALDAAIAAGVDIINLSLTGPPDPLLAELVATARQAGILVVAAAGNGGALARPAFPAALPNVLAVTATDASDALYTAANQGGYVDLAAPGVDVIAPGLNGSYPSVSGTSFASAHITAVAALLLELGAPKEPARLAELLSGAVVDLGASGRDERFGEGLLVACAAGARVDATLRCSEVGP